MSLSETDIATRIVQIKTQEEVNLFIDWVTSFPEIEWTEMGQEPDIIKALVFNQVLCNQDENQQLILSALLQKLVEMDSNRIKSLLKKGAKTQLLQQCVDRFNGINDEDAKAEIIPNEKSTKIMFTRTITVGTQESLKEDAAAINPMTQ